MNSKLESPHCVLCSARQLTNGIWECLAENSHHCPHALEFGFSHHICRHPEPHTFRNKDKTKKGTSDDSGFWNNCTYLEMRYWPVPWPANTSPTAASWKRSAVSCPIRQKWSSRHIVWIRNGVCCTRWLRRFVSTFQRTKYRPLRK